MATQFDFASLGNLFGGGGTPTGLDALLTEDQRKLLGRNAALSAAGALLQASGRSAVPISMGQALGSALQAGQQGYQQARAGSLQDLILGGKLKEMQTAQDLQKQIAGVFAAQPPAALSPEQQALMAPGMQPVLNWLQTFNPHLLMKYWLHNIAEPRKYQQVQAKLKMRKDTWTLPKNSTQGLKLLVNHLR